MSGKDTSIRLVVEVMYEILQQQLQFCSLMSTIQNVELLVIEFMTINPSNQLLTYTTSLNRMHVFVHTLSHRYFSRYCKMPITHTQCTGIQIINQLWR